MPRQAKELTAAQVKNLRGPGTHAVGGVPGLCLQVTEQGARSWILRTWIGQKRRSIGLGGYPAVTLAQARESARQKRELIQQGIDPVAERRNARESLIAAQAKRLSFEQAARRCHETKIPEFKNEKHKKDWISSLEQYAFPVIGELSVDNVELSHIMTILEPIWTTKTETATRVRQRLETVLDWARVSGYRAGENPARWTGNLKQLLPTPAKVRTRSHFPALSWRDVPEFMAELRKRQGVSARALEFTILTAARSGEVRLATWDEVDLESRVWTIPGERMKSGKSHRVPLSDAAITILENVPRLQGVDYVFPTKRKGHLSDMALSLVCRRMEVKAVPHGFRSSFKDWARNCTSYADEVSELALGHVSSDATRAAYARDELLPQREQLMQDWADFCEVGNTGADIVPFMSRAAGIGRHGA